MFVEEQLYREQLLKEGVTSLLTYAAHMDTTSFVERQQVGHVTYVQALSCYIHSGRAVSSRER